MSSTFTREEIEKELKSILVEDFEINESKITPDANLFEDFTLKKRFLLITSNKSEQ